MFVSSLRIENTATTSSFGCVVGRSVMAGGNVVVRTAGPNDTGTPVTLSDGYWLAPQNVGADVLCAGPGSTLTRIGVRTIVELRGLRGISCPGTPMAGALSGVL